MAMSTTLPWRRTSLPQIFLVQLNARSGSGILRVNKLLRTGESNAVEICRNVVFSHTRKRIHLLNEDLSREYQAIIAYVNHSQVLKGAAYKNIASELAVHTTEEFAQAIQPT